MKEAHNATHPANNPLRTANSKNHIKRPSLPRARPLRPMSQQTSTLLSRVDCVVITHFHLDHAGALPWLHLTTGYRGPVLMTAPTAALTPLMLKEAYGARMRHSYAALGVDAAGVEQAVRDCLNRVVVVKLNETHRVPLQLQCSCMLALHHSLTPHADAVAGSSSSSSSSSSSQSSSLPRQRVQRRFLEITPFYAGHVLGAAMFQVVLPETCHRESCEHGLGPPAPLPGLVTSVARRGVSVLYTGDYNMQATHHLRAADVQRLQPDVLISESTFATKQKHDPWSSCEALFLQSVATAIRRGGKVLIPCSSTGPVQDMCLMLERYWTLHGLEVPIFLSAGLSQRALLYYQLYAQWAHASGAAESDNPKGRGSFSTNAFKFSHIKPLPSRLHRLGTTFHHQSSPMVVLATAGMLKGGKSLQLFKLWCGDQRNLVILPGYCSAGTVGFQLLRGARRIRLDKDNEVSVQCQCVPVSFTCHTDRHGIVECVRKCAPKNIVLVHGERRKMLELRSLLQQLFRTPCFCPQRHQPLRLEMKATRPTRLWTAMGSDGHQLKSPLRVPHKLLQQTWYVISSFVLTCRRF